MGIAIKERFNETGYPRVEGGKISPRTTEDIVKVVEFDDEEWLYYKAFPINVGLIRGTVADENGNGNVRKFGTRVTGCGGFINISQSAKKLIFAGTFTAGGLELEIGDGKIKVVKEGNAKKFLKHVQQITFSDKWGNLKNILKEKRRMISDGR